LGSASGFKYADGFASVSDLKNERAEIIRRGSTPKEIAKVFGGNWLRMFRDVRNS
jgi:microsomal dipeptidase-like Zn-dependent dipeptidase